jgi:transposase
VGPILADNRKLTNNYFCETHTIAEARSLGLKALDAFCQTLENWLDGIANYFVTRSSNGPTEGFNNGLRSILSRAFGMQSFENFRARVLHIFGKPKPQESPDLA